MVKDFWDPVVEASIGVDPDGAPKFVCTMQARFSQKTVTVYLDERATRKAVTRKFTENMSDTDMREMRPVIDRIVDDLFDRFGSSGILEWNAAEADRCNSDWSIRMLRRDLKKRGLPDALTRDQVECVLNELYVVEPVLGT